MIAHRRVPVVAKDVHPERCTSARRLAALQRVPFFAGLSAAEMTEVNALFRASAHDVGATIYFSGDQAARLYVVTEGKVKLLRHTASGQDIVLDILAPGEIFGGLPALGEATYDDTAQAQSPCCVIGIDAGHFATVLKSYPAVAVSVLTIVGDRLREAHDRISDLVSTPVEVRVATALVKLAQKLGVERDGRLLIETPLSRPDLAALTGATTESVSRVMSQFRRDGLIESGRGWTALCAPDRLAEIAEAAGEELRR
ncbi:MAG TPA: Crp/Fnr family transcriptional regulator [Jiangellaceae bacterium]|nr:Crp/Fnr family transcriptional regulator [Jiangellaceae bacterium]